MRLLLFSYPTPQMARAQIEAFQSLDRVMAKRTGSLIAVIPDPQSADDAERLLARVAYDAEVTMTNHDALTAEQNWAQTIVNIFIFAGALCVLMVVGGLAVAFARAGITQVAPNSIFAMSKDADLTELHLSAGDKPGPNK